MNPRKKVLINDQAIKIFLHYKKEKFRKKKIFFFRGTQCLFPALYPAEFLPFVAFSWFLLLFVTPLLLTHIALRCPLPEVPFAILGLAPYIFLWFFNDFYCPYIAFIALYITLVSFSRFNKCCSNSIF